MRLRKNTCSIPLTVDWGMKAQLEAMRMVRQWYQEIPAGDSIAIRCESEDPERQFRVWRKWLETRENPGWEISETHHSFFLYKRLESD